MRACELNQSVDRAAPVWKARCNLLGEPNHHQAQPDYDRKYLSPSNKDIHRHDDGSKRIPRLYNNTNNTLHVVIFLQVRTNYSQLREFIGRVLAMPQESTDERGNVLAWKAQRLEANIVLFRLLRLREFATICPNGRRHLCHKQHRRGPATR
jgi:hypothetical protein